MSYRNLNKAKNKYKSYVLLMWTFFIVITLGLSGTFYYASTGGLGEMPDLKVLENPKTNLASEVISSDNKTLGKYYFNDNRTPVIFDELKNFLIIL